MCVLIYYLNPIIYIHENGLKNREINREFK